MRKTITFKHEIYVIIISLFFVYIVDVYYVYLNRVFYHNIIQNRTVNNFQIDLYNNFGELATSKLLCVYLFVYLIIFQCYFFICN